MTKYTGKDQTLTFNSLTSGTNFCITSTDLNMGGDMYKAACTGDSKTTVTGQLDVILTVNGFVDSASFDELFDESTGGFRHGATATDLVYRPEGAGSTKPEITDTTETVCVNPTFSAPADGVATFTMELHINGYAIAAQV